MLRSLDLNTAAEKGIVKGFTLQTRARLSEQDSLLPQVLSISEMVERGIGVVSPHCYLPYYCLLYYHCL